MPYPIMFKKIHIYLFVTRSRKTGLITGYFKMK